MPLSKANLKPELCSFGPLEASVENISHAFVHHALPEGRLFGCYLLGALSVRAGCLVPLKFPYLILHVGTVVLCQRPFFLPKGSIWF